MGLKYVHDALRIAGLSFLVPESSQAGCAVRKLRLALCTYGLKNKEKEKILLSLRSFLQAVFRHL
jgi:hypothetical protein